MEAIDTGLLRFESDVPLRRKLQPAAARRHPGKTHLGFLAYLLDRYASRGGRLVDPFGGAGSLLLATLPPWRCAVLLNELEPQWAAQARATWAHMQASPAQPAGTAAIWQGDARHLGGSGLLPFDGLVTSPPYLDQFGVPPEMGRAEYIEAQRHGYKRGYDALITSPPYADALSGQRHKPEERRFVNDGPTSPETRHRLRQGYAPGTRDPAQIGNLAGRRYWAAMGAVWAACVPLVRPGGWIIVILKNIVRANQEVDLIGGTRSQLENLGCTYVTTHYRAVAPGPFHRIRQKARPDALVIDREGALVLRREGAHG